MKGFLKEWVAPALIAIILVIVINIFLFQLVTVPTGSMISTILPGDKLFVNKFFNVDEVQRGEILVFKSNEMDMYLVKRLIGLPNEKVEIKSNGEIFIDGEKLYEPYALVGPCQEQTFVVPEDCFFFLGDNRPNSRDARYWSNPYINKKDVIGKAAYRFFPIYRFGRIE